MTYDPRRGESSYLGMDADEYDDLLDDAPESPHVSSSRPLYRSEADDTLYRNGTSSFYQSNADDTLYRDSTDASFRPSAVDDTLYREGSRAQQGAPVPRTMLRARPATPRDTGTLQGTAARSPLRRPTSSRDAMRAVPSPAQQPYEPHNPSFAGSQQSRGSGTLALFKALVLFMLALVLRAAALLLAVLVVASAFLTGSARATLISALNLTALLVPSALLGQFVMETPFGGVLRGDLAIASFLLFLADWICMRFSASLRYGRERGY